METILITGGTGLIGRQLTSVLTKKGFTIIWLTRKILVNEQIEQYLWDWKKKEIDHKAIERADLIIHLAGANINGERWSKAWKKEIYDSRIKSTEFLFDVISNHGHHIRTFISASAVGYYDIDPTDKIFYETDLPASNFLGSTCTDWEKSVNQISNLNIRTVNIRTGVVLDSRSETFLKLCFPVRWGMGAAIGTGKQYFPWIHLEDLCGIYLKAITDETIQGAYNAVAPCYLTNYALMKILSEKMKRPFFLPNIPAFMIKLIFGEFADTLLKGNRISSEKIIHAGYIFKYENIENALKNLLETD